MRPRVKFGFRLVTAVFCGFVVSGGVNFAICRFGGDGICRDRIWPAATMLGTGFEGQWFAWSVTTRAWAALLRLGFYFLFKKVGPVKYEYVISGFYVDQRTCAGHPKSSAALGASLGEGA